jgi:hypothetical protein
MLTIKDIKRKSPDIILQSKGSYKDDLSFFVLWKTKKTFHGIVFSKKIGVGTFNGTIVKEEGIKMELSWVLTTYAKKKRNFPTRIVSVPIGGTKVHYHRGYSAYEMGDAEDSKVVRWKQFHHLHPHWI